MSWASSCKDWRTIWTGGVALQQEAGQREGWALGSGLGQVGSLPDSPGSGCDGGRAVTLQTLFRTSLDWGSYPLSLGAAAVGQGQGQDRGRWFKPEIPSSA